MKLRMAVAATLCIGLICGIASTQGYAQGAQITVYNPMGEPPPIKMKAMAPRLDTLDGKTIYFLSSGFPNSGNFLEVMKEWFADNHPKVNIIVPPAGLPELRNEIREKGDAVFFAVGH